MTHELQSMDFFSLSPSDFLIALAIMIGIIILCNAIDYGLKKIGIHP